MKTLYAFAFFTALFVSSALAQTVPTIASISNSQVITQGQPLSLSVSVNGTAPFTYVWKKGGTAITGATASTFSIPAVATTDSGSYTVTITNSAGHVDSGAILVDVTPAAVPYIYYSPNSSTYTVGDTLYLSISVGGTSPFTYVWKKGTTTIATTNDSSYSKANAAVADSGSYTVTITNVAGSVTSSAFTVTVNAATAPVFSYSPSGGTINSGDYAYLSAGVSNSNGVTYQWYKDGAAVSNANSSYYYADEAGSYTVKATNSVGTTTSSAAVVTIRPSTAPTIVTITSGPVTVTTGESISLYGSSNGTAPLTYQWQKDGVAITGSTSSSFYRSNVTAADAGIYSLMVTNAVGSATSGGTSVSVSNAQLPIITYHPASRAVYPGDYVSLSVGASGTGQLTYAWKKDGVAIANSNTSGLYVSGSIAASDAGEYTVSVTNSQGTVTSQPATVTVLAAIPPTISQQPASVSILPGEFINLSVGAAARPSPSYQWKKDGVAITGATGYYYSKYGAASSDSGSYTVTVTNAGGSVTSDAATVSVGSPTLPKITAHPSSASLLLNDYFSLYVSVANPDGATVQWYHDGTLIPGATYWSYYIFGAQPSQAGAYHAIITNSGGSATSDDGVVTVDLSTARPVITYVTGSQAVGGGSSAQPSINVKPGLTNYTVAWKKDGVVVPNATSLYLSLPSFDLSSEGIYTAEVTVGATTYTSRSMELTLLNKGVAPRFVKHPGSLSRVVGENAYFDVQVTGEAPFTAYQWYKGSVPIPGATGSTYNLNNITLATAGTYSVKVTNRISTTTSNTATLTVGASSATGVPIFSSHPVSQTLTAGDSYLSLGVGIWNPTFSDTYQWYKDGSAIANATSSNYYASGSVTTATAGRYKVVVTNSAGSATSFDAIVSVTARATGPSFTTQPFTQSAYTGGSVTFSAAATSASTVTYQWRKDGAAIAGATGASLTLNNLQTSDAGSYTVLATNSDGSTSSSIAVLTLVLGVAPVIAVAPTPQVGGLTGSASFSVTASGTPAPTYQWKKNGTDISGATSATLSLTQLVASDAATYSVVVTNPAGTVTSPGASLVVYDQIPSSPAFTTQPQGRAAAPGETVTFTVAVTGFPTPTLRWYKNGTAIDRATSATLSLGVMTQALAGQYYAVASNVLGSTESARATLTYAASPYAGTYFGTLSSGEPWALKVEDDGSATFLSYLSGNGKIIYVDNVKVGPTGAFSFGEGATASKNSVRAVTAPLADHYFSGLVSGQIIGSNVTGQVAGTTGSFSGAEISTSTSAAAMAGTYDAVPLGTGLGEVHAIAAPDGTLLLVAVDGSGVRGGTGTVTSGGAFIVTQAQFTYSGTLGSSTGSINGTYQPVGGTAVVIAPPPTAGTGIERLINVSTRGKSGTGSNTLIVGFVISGSAPQDVLLRAVGPTLGTLGVSGYLPNPQLKLFKGSTPILENDDWSVGGITADITAAGTRLGAYPLPVGSGDAALLAHLDPGVYSAHVTTSDNSTGVALMEVYDASLAGSSGSKVVNLSARGSVATGDDILIIGFVIEGSVPKKILVRGLGPALAGAGVAGALENPKLQLYRNGVKVNENDDWSGGSDAVEIAAAASAVGAYGISSGSKDSALLVYLAPGVYSAHVSGVNNTSGIALVEVYEVP